MIILEKTKSCNSPLNHLKNNYNVKQLDYVIITHPHLDHIDDILNFDSLSPKIFKRPKQLTNKEVMEGVQEKDKPKFKKYCEINDRYNSPIKANSPDSVSNPDNWGFTKFKPLVLLIVITIIIIIKIQRFRICRNKSCNSTGDNEKCSFDELLEDSNFKDAITNADILLAPHHGRESGYWTKILWTWLIQDLP